MGRKKLYNYRVYCNTETAYKYIWGKKKPTKCPDNSEHSISPNTITIVDKLKEEEVIIKHEIDVSTGGNYKSQGYSFTVGANLTDTLSVSWPFPVTVMTVHIQTMVEDLGNTISGVVFPETTIGTCTSSVATGDTSIHVSSSVITNVSIGYECFIDSEFLGKIISIDDVNNILSVEIPVSQNYASGSLIKFQVRMLENHNLGFDCTNNTVGSSTMGGTYLPTGATTNVIYTNNSNSQKTCRFMIEYLY
jgi:hypothetical protein